MMEICKAQFQLPTIYVGICLLIQTDSGILPSSTKGNKIDSKKMEMKKISICLSHSVRTEFPFLSLHSKPPQIF